MKLFSPQLTLAAAGILAVASLTGCAGGSTGGSGTSQPKLAFIQGVAGDEFYVSMQCGIESAAKAAGAAVNTQGPNARLRRCPVTGSFFARSGGAR